MGFRVDIDGLKIETADYSVEEASSPLAAGDSSGAVGSFTVTVPVPDPSLPLPSQDTPWRRIRLLGPQFLIDKSVRLYDSRKGFTLGTISSAEVSRDGGTISLSGVSRLGSLNVYGIQAQPFVGTLRDAFAYYLGLAEIDTDLFVDDEIADRQVVFPGWHGELWYYLKLMAAAQDCDISLVSGVILLRAIRKRVATQNRDTTRSISTGGSTLAQAVEVYQYNNRPITNELVYPPGGWNPEVEVLNVNAGETAEYTLELSASVSSIQTPEMQTSVGQGYNSSSVYTVVADDGLPVSPSLWAASGGSVSVEIDEDTSHLIVRMTGATGVPNASGAAAQNFSLALGSDTTGNRYSTLRIVGTGVAYTKVKKRVRTGVPASKTATEIGVTIDNPFISTTNDLYRAGTRAAKQYAGAVMSLTGSVIAINRRGDTGQATYPTYGQVENELKTALGGTPSYADVRSYYESELGSGTSGWVESRRNLMYKSFQLFETPWRLSGCTVSVSNDVMTITPTGTGAWFVQAGDYPTTGFYHNIEPGGSYRVLYESSAPLLNNLIWYYGTSNVSVSPVDGVFTIPEVANGGGAIRFAGTGPTVVTLSKPTLVVASDTSPVPFTGTSPSTGTTRYSWLNSSDESPAIMETLQTSPVSYETVRQYWFEFFRDDDIDQVFGNVQGARIYDRGSRRWYRVRQGSLSPSAIGISSADDDLIHDDIQELYDNLTYNGVQSVLDGLTYREVELAGLFNG